MLFKRNLTPLMNKPIQLIFLVLTSISFFLSVNVLYLARSDRVYQVLAINAYHEQLNQRDRIALGSHIQKALLTINSIQFRSSQGFELFNSKEVLHMLDVAKLLQKVFYWMLFSAFLLILGIKFTSPLSFLLCKRIGYYIVGILLSLSFLLILFFSSLFHVFHLVSFTNDFWLLDPRADFLIRLFPLSFFQVALVWILLSSILLSLLFWLGIPKLRTIIRS